MGMSNKPRRLATMSDEQQALFNQVTGGATQGFDPALQAILGQLDPQKTESMFQQAVAEPTMRNFSQVIAPEIRAQSGMDRGASAIDKMIVNAGADIQKDLASQLAGFQMAQQQQGIGNISNLTQMGLAKEPFAYQQPGLSPFAQVLTALIGAGGQGAGAYYGAKNRRQGGV